MKDHLAAAHEAAAAKIARSRPRLRAWLLDLAGVAALGGAAFWAGWKAGYCHGDRDCRAEVVRQVEGLRIVPKE